MLRIFIPATFLLSAAFTDAQMKEGKIIFESNKQVRAITNNPFFENMAPRIQKEKFELLFRDNQTFWRKTEEDNTSWEVPEHGRMTIMLPERDQVIYSDLTLLKKTEQRILAEKKYLIKDSIQRLDWKITQEKRIILGYECRKAIANTIQQFVLKKEENGKTFTESIPDTLNTVAWYAPDIPVYAGPDVYLGQLPGMILEVNINDGKIILKAIEISAKENMNDIKEPKTGKIITAADYQKEKEKILQNNSENAGKIYKTKN